MSESKKWLELKLCKTTSIQLDKDNETSHEYQYKYEYRYIYIIDYALSIMIIDYYH